MLLEVIQSYQKTERMFGGDSVHLTPSFRKLAELVTKNAFHFSVDRFFAKAPSTGTYSKAAVPGVWMIVS